MRAFAILALIVSVPALATGPAEPGNNAARTNSARPACKHTTTYLAGESSIYRGRPLTPQKLTQLPPGTTYMAVLRRIDGCEAPLTMVDYRSSLRR